MEKKYALIALFLFAFRPFGSSMDFITCEKAELNDCGIHAWYCSTALQYKCLTNLESPDRIIPKDISDKEFRWLIRGPLN